MIVLFIKKPNLPTSKVKCVIVDCNAPESLFDFFDVNKIKYIKSTYIENTIDAVSTHPDMQICHVGGKNFVCEPLLYSYYYEKLRDYGINLIKGTSVVKSTYPYDISYNVVVTGKILMHNVSYTEEKIMDYIESTGISIYNVKQGYTKCATCIIDENAFITSDHGIYKMCDLNKTDCLLINNGKIKLGDRYDGFIGGCCGMIDRKKLLFCGNISAHSSYDVIIDFAKKHDVKIISSSDDVLTDVGSIIPVIQE